MDELRDDLLQRQWLVAEEGDDDDTPHLRIVQWNILADALAITNGSLQETSFIRVPVQYLQWEYRRPLILQQLSHCKADIICLQEVDHFNELQMKGYDGIFFAKPHSPCLLSKPNNGPDGCAILYNTLTVKLIERKDIILNGRDSNQVAILVMFEWSDIPDKPHFCVGVTHLKSKAQFEKLRLSQGNHLLNEMKRFACTKPFMICGDFNATPNEQVYKHYISSTTPRLNSGYATYNKIEPDFTSWKYRKEGESKYTGDYIWYSCDDFKMIGLLKLPSVELIGKIGLPNEKYPTDHLALCAEFRVK